ncbi:MAG: hypothetical protein AVDCRST_MAG68-782, partial [uncultured Gemmatimonadetes bacterium]
GPGNHQEHRHPRRDRDRVRARGDRPGGGHGGRPGGAPRGRALARALPGAGGRAAVAAQHADPRHRHPAPLPARFCHAAQPAQPLHLSLLPAREGAALPLRAAGRRGGAGGVGGLRGVGGGEAGAPRALRAPGGRGGARALRRRRVRAAGRARHRAGDGRGEHLLHAQPGAVHGAAPQHPPALPGPAGAARLPLAPLPLAHRGGGPGGGALVRGGGIGAERHRDHPLPGGPLPQLRHHLHQPQQRLPHLRPGPLQQPGLLPGRGGLLPQPVARGAAPPVRGRALHQLLQRGLRREPRPLLEGLRGRHPGAGAHPRAEAPRGARGGGGGRALPAGAGRRVPRHPAAGGRGRGDPVHRLRGGCRARPAGRHAPVAGLRRRGRAGGGPRLPGADHRGGARRDLRERAHRAHARDQRRHFVQHDGAQGAAHPGPAAGAARAGRAAPGTAGGGL